MRTMIRPVAMSARHRRHATRRCWWVAGAVAAAAGRSEKVWAQPAAPAGPASGTDLLTQVLQFTYTIAHAIGQAIVSAIQTILPQATVPPDLVDPIGFLSVLTIFVLMAGVARRVAWIIVGIGWVLIGVRLVLVILRR